jgi:hypothetical protein
MSALARIRHSAAHLRTIEKAQRTVKRPLARGEEPSVRFRCSRQGKRVFHIDAEIAHCVLDLAMSEEDLDGTKVAGRPVYDRSLRSAKRVRAILALHQTDAGHPFIDKPCILAGAEMPIMINPTGKDMVVHCATPPFKPRQQARPSVWEQFELNWPTGFLLHHDRTRSDLPTTDKVAALYLHEVAAYPSAEGRGAGQLSCMKSERRWSRSSSR